MAEKLNIYDFDKYNINDTSIALSFEVFNHSELSSKKGTFSKTIKIPATKKNNSLLSWFYDEKVEGFFDFNKKRRAKIQSGGVLEFDGWMRVANAEMVNGEPYSYSILLFSDIKSWVSEISSKNLSDLEIQAIPYDNDSIEDSWTNTYEDGYVYPLINYGGYEDYTSVTNLDYSDFRPAVFVYTILESLFSNTSYSLKKGVFKDPEWINLIIPYTGKDLKIDDSVAKRESLNDADLSTPIIVGDAKTYITIENRVLNSEIDEAGNLIDSDTKYKVPYTGKYDFSALNMKLSNSRNVFNNDITVRVTVDRLGNSLNSYDLYNEEHRTITGSSDLDFEINLTDIQLQATDEIYITVQAVGQSGAVYDVFSSGTKNFNIVFKNTSVINGLDIDFSRLIGDVKALDFVKSLIEIGNLIPVTDENAKTIEFLHYDEYFKRETEVVDWNDKLDIGKPYQIEMVTENTGSNYLFQWKKDEKDVNLNLFNKEEGRDYSKLEVLSDKDYLSTDKDITKSVYFAPCIMGEAIDGLNMPMIDLRDDEGLLFQKELSSKLLVYNGLNIGTFKFNVSSKPKYPYAYFYNKKDTSALSLNFRSENIGERTLYDRYYTRMINRIDNGRIMICYLNLSPIDIMNLDLRRPVYVNNSIWYINKIEDYLAGTNKSTKVELIKY